MSSSTPDSFDITQPPKVKGKKFSSKPQLKRQGSLSAFASKIKRNVTEGWDQNFQREDAWGRKILDSVHEKQKKGVEGDIPGINC